MKKVFTSFEDYQKHYYLPQLKPKMKGNKWYKLGVKIAEDAAKITKLKRKDRTMKKVWTILIVAVWLLAGCNSERQLELNIKAGTAAYVAYMESKCVAIEDVTDKVACDIQLTKARLYMEAVRVWFKGDSVAVVEFAYREVIKHADEEERATIEAIMAYIRTYIEIEAEEEEESVVL